MRLLHHTPSARLVGAVLLCVVCLLPDAARGADPAAVLTASDGVANDRLGVHVAAGGDVLVVGASFDDGAAGADQGAVYVYVRPVDGWGGGLTPAAKLLPSDPVAGQQFGHRVAIDGDTIVVGAPGPAAGSTARDGAAYVFVRPAGGWSGTLTETAKLLASDGRAGDELGVDVAIDDAVILAGASFDDVGAHLNQGSAYVFLRPADGWSGVVPHAARLVASDGLDGDLFGSRVAIAGGSLVVSAPYADLVTRDNQGAAYVFNLPGGGWTGTLTEDGKLTAGDSALANDNFGRGLAAVGDTIVVSECRGVPPVLTGANGYVFVRPPGGWYGDLLHDATLFASDEGPDSFGCALAVSAAGEILVGAALADVGDVVDQGAAYRYRRPDTGWSGPIGETEKIVADDGVAGDRTGLAVAFTGELPVVAAPFSDVGGNVDQGRVLVFRPGRTLTVQVEGGGAVTSLPVGIDCPGDCGAIYDDDAVVTLSAIAPGGGQFTGWGGDADCSDGSVTMDADKACTATFVAVVMRGVRISVDGEGRVTSDPAGIDCRQDCLEFFPQGTALALAATPDPGYEFTGWSGSADCSDGQLTLDADVGCTGTFAAIVMRGLRIVVEGEGRVTSVPAGVDCTADCLEFFRDGTVLTLTAAPDPGSEFAGWSGSADCSDGQITLDADVGCTGTFTAIVMHGVRIVVEGEGRVTSVPAGVDCTADCLEFFRDGTVLALTATPDAGSEFAGWAGDADCSDGEIAVSGDIGCTARFRERLPDDLPDLTGRWSRLEWFCVPWGRQQICLVLGRFDLANDSPFDAGESTLRFRLSADTMADKTDLVVGAREVDDMPAGETRAIGTVMLLPIGVRPRGMYLLAVVDADDAVAESDETNNVVAFGPL